MAPGWLEEWVHDIRDAIVGAINAGVLAVTGPLTNTELRATAVQTRDAAVNMAAADSDAGADNTAVVITYAGAAGMGHCISGVAWSYDGDPTGGKLTITDGGVTMFEIDITKSGPGFVPFPRPKKGAANSAVVVTLAAGGGTVEGCLNVLDHWSEV